MGPSAEGDLRRKELFVEAKKDKNKAKQPHRKVYQQFVVFVIDRVYSLGPLNFKFPEFKSVEESGQVKKWGLNYTSFEFSACIQGARKGYPFRQCGSMCVAFQNKPELFLGMLITKVTLQGTTVEVKPSEKRGR